MALEPTPGPRAGWDERASRRFLALAGARAGSQVLGLVWFLAAARVLTDASYGELATGLAFMSIFAGIGDLGTTRGVVRHVAGEHALLGPVYRRALLLRTVGGLAVGVVTAAAIALAPVPVDPGIVLLAGLVATASGATELAYAALRSVGRVRTEMVLLVAERAAFLVIGLLVLWRGGGALAVLVAYLATNIASAVAGALAVRRTAVRDAPFDLPWSLTDAESRSTALGFAMVTVTPRIAPVLLALLASSVAVADFSVAQRPIEAMTLFALSTSAPLLPIIRARLAGGRVADAERAAVSVLTALGVALVPVVAWCLVSPGLLLDALFGSARYDDAPEVIRLLALTALTWAFRGIAEFVLLGQERARTFLGVTTVGAVVTLVVGIPLVLAHGARGAAWSVLIAEVVTTVLLCRVTPALAGRKAARSYLLVLGVGAGSAATAWLVRGAEPASFAALAAWGAVGVALAVRASRRLEVAR